MTEDALRRLPIALDARAMEARSEAELPRGSGWQYEPKFDGFRALAFRADGAAALTAKSGRPLARYFPEVAARLLALGVDDFVLDGELVIEGGGFSALQLRLHPAESRVRRLAAETPAALVLFDLLVAPGGRRLVDEPLSVRRAELERLFAKLAGAEGFRLAPATIELAEAERWLRRSGSGDYDGVVAKRLDGRYLCGERAMVKVKRVRTADCVVAGFRYLKDTKQVGSLLLGLYDDDGRLNHVGFTATISSSERPALTRGLQAMTTDRSFTGAAPGGPSRWSTEKSADWTPVRPELVVEVAFDQVTDARFRHGTRLVRWRPDKAPAQCRMEQLEA